MSYLRNLLIGIDQLANVVLAGSPDETLSARAWRTERAGKILGRFWRPVIDTLFWFEPDHCRLSYEVEELRAQLHRAYTQTAVLGLIGDAGPEVGP